MEVTEEFKTLRRNVLNYTSKDMNLELENDKQVYLAIFDVPNLSIMEEFINQTFALLYGLNVHIYFENGNHIIGLEKNKNVLKAMQSLLISSCQILHTMKLVTDYEYYKSNNIRLYLKLKKEFISKK